MVSKSRLWVENNHETASVDELGHFERKKPKNAKSTNVTIRGFDFVLLVVLIKRSRYVAPQHLCKE